MIDVNVLNKMVADINASQEKGKVKNHLKKCLNKYEEFIDDSLLKKANEGKRELEILFNINKFEDFFAVVCNYHKYKKHNFNVDISATDNSKEFFISSELMVEFINAMQEELMAEFINNNNYFKKFMLAVMMCDIKVIKFNITF
jgi:hypothetical protein